MSNRKHKRKTNTNVPVNNMTIDKNVNNEELDKKELDKKGDVQHMNERIDVEHMFVSVLNEIKQKRESNYAEEKQDTNSSKAIRGSAIGDKNTEKKNKKETKFILVKIVVLIICVIGLLYGAIYFVAINTDPIIQESAMVEEEIFEYGAYVIEMDDDILMPGKFMTCYDTFLISTIGTDKTIEMTLDKVQAGDVSDDEFVEDSRTIKIVPNETMEVIVDANDWYDVEFVFVENDDRGFIFNENAGFDMDKFSKLTEKEMVNNETDESSANEVNEELNGDKTEVPTIIIYSIESKHLTGGEKIYMPIYTVAENTIFNPADYLVGHLYPTLVGELEKRIALKDDVMQRLFDYQGIPIKPKAQDEIFRDFIEIKDELKNLIGTADAKEVGSDQWVIGIDHQWATTKMTLELDENLTVLDGTLEIDKKK